MELNINKDEAQLINCALVLEKPFTMQTRTRTRK